MILNYKKIKLIINNFEGFHFISFIFKSALMKFYKIQKNLHYFEK